MEMVLAYAYLSLGDLDNMYSSTISALQTSVKQDKNKYIKELETLKSKSDNQSIEKLFYTLYPTYKEKPEAFYKEKIARADDNEEATPPKIMVRIEPFYPIKAARDGIEGCIDISFSLNASGRPINIRVIKSDHEGVFDKEVLRAVSLWMYRPHHQNGKPVPLDGLTEQFCFKVDKSN